MTPMPEPDYVEAYGKRIATHLVGRRIVGVSYMTKAETDDCGWYNRAIVIELDNGVALYPSADSEGNAAGALFTTIEDMGTIPAMPL